MSPRRILPGMFDESESPSEQFVRLRDKFREDNLQRVRETLSDYTVLKDGEKVSTGFKINDERHSMDDNNSEGFDLVIPSEESSNFNRLLSRRSRETLLHETMQVPPDSNLPFEDLDGPPIQDLTDESQIFSAIDQMIARGKHGEDSQEP